LTYRALHIRRCKMLRLLVLLVILTAGAVADDWRLGSLQTTGFVGFNLEDGRGRAEPSVGLGLDFGLCRYLAVTTAYSWNHVASANVSRWFLGGAHFRDVLIEAQGRESKHDLLAGLRFHVPTRTRMTPYIAGLGGVTIARITVSGHAEGLPISMTVRDSMAKPAGGAGAGVEIYVGRGASLLVEAKAVRPLDMYWYGHVGFGFAYRPSKKSDRDP
jgi:hypothetical protein